MKVRLDDIHSPCQMCFLRGIFYNPDAIRCQRCEYNIALKLLKRVLKENDHCTLCKNCKRLGGGYYECSAKYDDDGSCKKGENLLIDWELVCKEYNLEYEPKGE